jgi:hypothetical protein
MDEQTLLLMAPLIGLDIIMRIVALVILLRGGGSKHLPRNAWIAVIVLVCVFGWASYLIAGREDH